MRTRQLAAAAAAAAALASLLALAGPAQAAGKVSCSTKGVTIAATRNARIFAVTVRHLPRLYGCATVTRRLSYIGRVSDDGGEGIDRATIALTGPRIAYARQTCWDSGCSETVIVDDLKARKELSVAQATPGDLNNRVTNIVLSATGIVGWIAEDQTGDPPVATARFVVARQPGLFRGIDVVPIASGLDIVSGSLALAGSTLYWTQGTARSAPLP